MNNKVAVTLLFSVCLHCILQDDDLQLFLLEYPLRTLVMVAQVQAGMWRRNGYAVINQVDKTIAGFWLHTTSLLQAIRSIWLSTVASTKCLVQNRMNVACSKHSQSFRLLFFIHNGKGYIWPSLRNHQFIMISVPNYFKHLSGICALSKILHHHDHQPKVTQPSKKIVSKSQEEILSVVLGFVDQHITTNPYNCV